MTIRVGMPFGRLEISQNLGRAGDGTTLWRCECTCRDWTTATSAELLAGDVVSCGDCGSGAPWSATEDELLRREYSDRGMRELMAMLDRTDPAITNRARVLGLRKSETYWRGPHTGRIAVGNTPPNKGRKGMKPRGRAAETTFKPGNRPHTWRPIGTERVSKDGYLERKVTDTGYTPRDWRPVHHLVWQEAGGEIPAGHALIFRNGDKRDFAITNLELISRGELMARNTIHNYPPEVVDVMRLRGTLNRKIRRLEREHEEPDAGRA